MKTGISKNRLVDKILNSTLVILQSIFFLFILLFSFYGYGRVLVKFRVFNASEAVIQNFGLQILIGIGFFLCLSGYFELFKIGSDRLFLAYTAMGLVLLWVGRPDIQFSQFVKYIQTNFVNKVALSLAGMVCLSAVFLNLTLFDLNIADDYQGYMVFAKRILQEGYQGYDPFSVRLVEQGFGGGNFLNALFMTGSPSGNLHLTDAGLGLLLVLLIGISLTLTGSKKPLNIVSIFFIAVGLLIFAPIVNISPLVLGGAFMYGTLLISIRMPLFYSQKQSLLLGFLLASFVILKGTFLIPAFIAAVTHYLSRLWLSKSTWVLREALITLASFLFFLIPWLISNHLFHATAFYPLLGKGFSNTDSFGLLTYTQFIANELEFLPLYGLLLASWMLLNSRAIDLRIRCYSIILVGMVIVVTTLLAATPGGFFRYSYITLATPTAFLLTLHVTTRVNSYTPVFNRLSHRTNKLILYFLILISAVLMLHQTKRALTIFIKNGYLAAKTENTKAKLSTYKEIQSSIPEHVSIITQTTNPYFFDFSRNQIFVMDYPGNAGAKPGIPFISNPTGLANYFKLNKICYVVHSYLNWENQRKDQRFLSDMNSSYTWNRNLSTRSYLTNQQLMEFDKHFQVIYDNGNDRVFDICSLKN